MDSPISTDGTIRILVTTSLCLCEKTLEHFTKLQQFQHAKCSDQEAPEFSRSCPAP